MRGSRRVAVVLVVLVALSGCNLLGSGPIEATASPASVCEGALSATGYVTDTSTWENRSREVSVAGNSRTVQLNSYVTGYVREGADGEAGGFALLASPQASVGGQALNPVGDRSPRELVTELGSELDQYGQLQDIEKVGTEQVTMLGTETTRTRFSATGTDGNGDPVDVYLTVARVAHGGDFVVAGSIHERENPRERDRLDRLAACLEHADRSPTDDGTPIPGPDTPDRTPTETPTERRVITGFHPPQVDGTLYGHTGQELPEGKAGEWADGDRRSVTLRSADGDRTFEGTLYAKEVGDSIYLGLSVPQGVSRADVGRVTVQVDRDRDGELSAGDVRLLRVPGQDGPSLRLQQFRNGEFTAAADGAEGVPPGSVSLSAGDDEDPGLVVEAQVDRETLERKFGEIDAEGEGTGIWAGIEVQGDTYGVSGIDISDQFSGTGYIDYRRIRPDLPSDDLAVGHIEITQSVQTRSNSLRLVREKETLARVFVTHDNADPTEVTVLLKGYDTSGGGYRSLGTVTETFDAPPGTPDRDENESAYIELPAHWTDVDGLAVTARVYRFAHTEETPNDNLRRTTVDFVDTFDPTIYYVRADVGSKSTPSRSPTGNVDAATAKMADAYPVADPTFTELPGSLADEFESKSTSERINEMNGIAGVTLIASAISPSVEPPAQVFGFTPDFAGISDPAWDSGNSFVAIGSVKESAHRELIMAHEINHNLGDNDWGKHAGNGSKARFANGCGAGADSDWSRINPTNTFIQEVGWDPAIGIIPHQYPEFESYCQIWEVRGTVPGWTGNDPPQWISDYRWSRLLNRFDGWDGNPAHPDLRSGGGSGSAETAADRADGRELLNRETPTARLVSGTLFRGGGGELRPTFEQPGRVTDRVDRPPVEDPHSVLVVRYADGSTREVPLRARFEDGLEEYGDSPRRPFTVALDDNGTITSIDLVDAETGEVADRLESTGYSADAEFDIPETFARGQPTGIAVGVQSNAETTLYRKLLYTPDGENYYPFSSATTGEEFTAGFQGLPGGENARFVLLVSDGVETKFVASRPVTVEPAPPTVRLHRNQRYVVEGEPPEGEVSEPQQSRERPSAGAMAGEGVGDQSLTVRQVGVPVRASVGARVSLAVSTRDQWSDDLPPSALSWRAVDEDGRTVARQTGAPFTHRFTRPGTYEVTVTGTDPETGLTDTDTIRVVVSPPSLPDAELVDRFVEARDGEQ